jgi:Small integral membrane protein
MLHYAVVFLIIALIAAVFGFGGIASGAVGIAKILFFIFVVMAVVTFVMSLLKKKGLTPPCVLRCAVRAPRSIPMQYVLRKLL